jgi:hypothetical protein
MLLRQYERDARIQALQAKADQSQGEIHRRLEAQIKDIRQQYEELASAR